MAGKPQRTAKKSAKRLAKGKSVRKVRRNLAPTIYLAIGGSLLAATLFLFAYMNRHPEASATAPPSNVGERTQVQAGVHIQPPARGQYATDPPTSGQHYSIAGQAPVPWGFHAQSLAPEYWVHNLEHGGVAILYNCPSGCLPDQTLISKFIDSAPPEATFNEVKIVAVSYPVPGHRFALVAWGWRLFLDAWDAGQAERFYLSHVDHGPESVP